MKEYKFNEGKKITIYDIAKEAGVSASTVSRVLTNNAKVSPDKKEKIQELIDKYNFRPNALAKGLVETSRKVIGIIMADVRNPFYSNLFVSCEQAARAAGYSLFLENSLGEQEIEETQLDVMYEQRVDGIILVGGRVDDLYSNAAFVKKVNQVNASIPIVITGKLDGTSCHQVCIDAIQCTNLIMEHLISLGHKEIAIIGGHEDVTSSFEKRQQYKQLLLKHHLEYREEFGENFGRYDYETGYSKMNALFEKNQLPTAVIAINDFAAAGIINSILEHQLRIPDDISVISYDNTFICELTSPKLTSIDYNYSNFADKLISTIIAMCEKGSAPAVQLIEPSLVKRASTAPPKQE